MTDPLATDRVTDPVRESRIAFGLELHYPLQFHRCPPLLPARLLLMQRLDIRKDTQMLYAQRKPGHAGSYQAVRNQEFTPARQVVLPGPRLKCGYGGIETIGHY